MLLERLQAPGVLAALTRPGAYQPAWTAADRSFWGRIEPAAVALWMARGERAASAPWPPLAPLYGEYARTGLRVGFETAYFRRRQHLTGLAMAEALERQGRFTAPLLEALHRLCDEPSWVVPAHADQVIDLFAAETANLIAWVLRLFAAEPGFATTPEAGRAALAVRERVLDPYLLHDNLWWMGLNGPATGNWTPWCTSNCLGTALLMEPDPQRLAAMLHKACRSLDAFIQSCGDDGGCDEGPMYWNYAAGCLFDSLEMLQQASAGALDVFAEPAIHRLGRYIVDMHITGMRFVNFADCPPEVPVDGALVCRFGSRVGDAQMQALGVQMQGLMARYDSQEMLRLKIYRCLAGLAAPSAPGSAGPLRPAALQLCLPQLQVAVMRESPGHGQGWFVAAKGGHNDEGHNHNDVGNVIACHREQPVWVDAGLKQYTRPSFTAQRYDIWAMQSQFHNVPLVNGFAQRPGRDAAAAAALFEPGDVETAFTVDIAAAYPPEAALLHCQRRSRLCRDTGTVVVEDQYNFRHTGNHFEQRWLTPLLPRVQGGQVVLTAPATGQAYLLLAEPAPDRISLHAFALQDDHLVQAWRGPLYQVRLHYGAVGRQGCCRLTVLPQALDPAASQPSELDLQHAVLP